MRSVKWFSIYYNFVTTPKRPFLLVCLIVFFFLDRFSVQLFCIICPLRNDQTYFFTVCFTYFLDVEVEIIVLEKNTIYPLHFVEIPSILSIEDIIIYIMCNTTKMSATDYFRFLSFLRYLASNLRYKLLLHQKITFIYQEMPYISKQYLCSYLKQILTDFHETPHNDLQ